MIQDIKKIKKILNENHNDNGFSKSHICKLVVKEYRELKLNLNYRQGFIDTSSSTITDLNNNSITIDDFISYLFSGGILVLKRVTQLNVKVRRFFTIDYEEYQKLKKRRKIINKIKNTIYSVDK